MDKISVFIYMDYNAINSLVAKGLSIRKISTELKTSPTNIRYWLKKFNIKTIPRSEVSDYRYCPRCETENLKTEFYNRRNDYKGGQCVCCGYKKTNNALEFHHLNPQEKDFSISSAKFTKFDNRIIEELNKCALVCRNCHAEIHAGVIDLLPYKI